MAFNRDKAHEISDDGLLVTDGPHFVGDSDHPRVAFPAPSGLTYYYQTSTGTTWRWVIDHWEPLEPHVPEKLDREWSVPAWAQAHAINPIDAQNDDAVFDIEGSLVFDDLDYVDEPDPAFPTYPENFSYAKVDAGVTVSVPVNQQMLVDQVIDIEGTLDLIGAAVIVTDRDEDTNTIEPENFSYDKIPLGLTVQVPLNQQMFVDYPLDIEGTLDVLGRVSVNHDYESDEPGDNFGYRVIPLGKTVTIPEYQDMIVADNLEILGTLNAVGSFTVIYF